MPRRPRLRRRRLRRPERLARHELAIGELAAAAVAIRRCARGRRSVQAARGRRVPHELGLARHCAAGVGDDRRGRPHAPRRRRAGGGAVRLGRPRPRPEAGLLRRRRPVRADHAAVRAGACPLWSEPSHLPANPFRARIIGGDARAMRRRCARMTSIRATSSYGESESPPSAPHSPAPNPRAPAGGAHSPLSDRAGDDRSRLRQRRRRLHLFGRRRRRTSSFDGFREPPPSFDAAPAASRQRAARQIAGGASRGARRRRRRARADMSSLYTLSARRS